jgi:alpha-tubulin suppressor-like RCC1 family protein
MQIQAIRHWWLSAAGLVVTLLLVGCGDHPSKRDPELGTGSLQLQTANAASHLEGIVDLTRTIREDPFSLAIPLNGERPSVTSSLPVGSYRATLRDGWKLWRLATTSPTDVTYLATASSLAPNPATIASGETTQVTITISLGESETVVFGPGSVALAVDVEDAGLACGGCAPSDLCLAVGGSHRCVTPCDPRGNVANQCGGSECTPFSFTPTEEGGETPLYICNRAVAIATGQAHSCALKQNGAVTCWGNNGGGQLGSEGASQVIPRTIPGWFGVVALSAGSFHTCALQQAGTVACWGNNYDRQLGAGTAADMSVSPVTLPDLTNLVAVSAGYRHTCVMARSGSAACWGSNSAGQLGNAGASDPSPSPVAVSGLTNALALSAGGAHTCALTVDGAVLCWGRNQSGQLGHDSAGAPSASPLTVLGLTDAVALSGGADHTCALQRDGAVLCWGSNGSGQLGSGSGGGISASPVPVLGLSDAVAISAGESHVCAVRRSGGVACWGGNTYGQLGTGNFDDAASALAVRNITDAIAVSSSTFHTCALRRNGGVLCWGANADGQVGIGTPANTPTPVPVPVLGL